MIIKKKDYETTLPLLAKRITDLEKNGGGGGSSIVVDSAMSSVSTNPVQNKVVLAAIQEIPKGEQGPAGPAAQVGTFELDADGNLYYIEPE